MSCKDCETREPILQYFLKRYKPRTHYTETGLAKNQYCASMGAPKLLWGLCYTNRWDKVDCKSCHHRRVWRSPKYMHKIKLKRLVREYGDYAPAAEIIAEMRKILRKQKKEEL